MVSTSRRLVRRLAEMGWDEVRTRGGQELRKRLDLALYRAGAQRPPRLLEEDDGGSGRFFFDVDELPRLTSLLQKHLDSHVEATVQEADEICCHRFRLLGYSGLDYGPEIDWHLDAVHRRRAPLKPWFKIHFLDFSQVGDHKVTWELNRHQHLITLAKAWRFTQEQRYIDELLQQWYQWQTANPYPLGLNWCSSLEVAFRTLAWLWAGALTADCAAIPAAFAADLLQALAINGLHIERYLSTYFSPNTHLLGEAAALFFIGTLCTQIPESPRWRQRGWQLLLQEAKRQVRSDGVYFEQALHYHVYALDLFLHCRLLARRNAIEVPSGFDKVLQKMLTFLQSVSQGGFPESFGDDDGGRVFDPRRNRPEHLTDPLLIGALTFDRRDLLAAPRITEEALWLFGERVLAGGSRPDPSKSVIRPACFEAAGIYVMASAEPFAERMVIDAGPQGTGHSGHGHADALNATLFFGGRRWLIDPGTYCYSAVDGKRDEFRATAAHNTVRVDGIEQAVPEGPFAWSSLPLVRAERWVVGETCTLFSGSHTGYVRLPDPVLHRRFIFHLPGHFWLVRDLAEGGDTHDLEISWHFAPDLRVTSVNNGFIVAPRRSHPGTPGDNMALAVLPARDSGWRSALKSDYASPAYGSKQPAPMLRLTARVKLPTEHATLLRRLSSLAQNPGSLIHLTQEESPNENEAPFQAYRYVDQGSVHSLIFADRRASWRLDSWISDAQFFYCRSEGSQIMHFVLLDATFATLDGRDVFRHPQEVARLEWQIKEGVCRESSSHETAVRSIAHEALRPTAAMRFGT